METPEHLKPLEAAARIYCQKIGVDPDKGQPLPHPLIRGTAITVPLWYGAAEQLLDLNMMLQSLKEAAGDRKIVVAP